MGDQSEVKDKPNSSPSAAEPPLSYFDQWKQFQYWNYNCQLERWAHNHYSQMQSAMLYHQHYLQQQQSFPGAANPQATTTAPNNTPTEPPLPPAEYRIPGLMFRGAAEFIDFFILGSIKMMLFWIIMQTTGVVISDMGFQAIFTNKLQMMDLDVEELLSDEELQSMMLLTIFYRLSVCLYEFVFLWKFAATPGKWLFGLRVVEARSFSHSADGTLTLNPGTKPSAISSWNRCFVKNLSIAFLVPSFFTAFYYSYSRTSYDIVSNTVVVRKGRVRPR